VGGLTTLVEDGWTGFLVEGHDVDAFAKAASRILDDPSQAAFMSANAAIRARGFTWAQAASLLRSTYEELAAERLVGCR
jgi:D-inositol-3-phosphate glycosyltransferase